MIELFKGDSKTIKVAITNNGEAMDLTGFIAKLSIKYNEDDDSVALEELVDPIADPENGVVVFLLRPQKTSQLIPGTCVYDVQLSKGSDNTLEVFTVVKGNLRVIKDISD